MVNLKLAFRTLFKAPFVTVVAIISLALGIGANAAIFSLFNQMLLRPLPVVQPAPAGQPAAPGPKPGSNSCNQAGECEEVFSYPMFRDLERVQNVFTTIAAHRIFGANLAYRNQTISGEGVLVSGSYFPVLGIQPAVGRLLDPRDDQKVGESLVAVLSHGYWLSRFDGNPAVVNETLIVNGQHLTIVGVAPAGFEGTTLGLEAAAVRSDHAAQSPRTGLEPVRQPTELLGVRVRPPPAGRLDRSGTLAAQRAVSRDRQ